MNAETEPKPPRRTAALALIPAGVVFLAAFLFVFFIIAPWASIDGPAPAGVVLFGSAAVAAVPAAVVWGLAFCLGRMTR